MTKGQAGVRICRCGCGRPLLKKDGAPDWSRRRFATHDCLAADKRNRVAAKRVHQVRHPGPRLMVDGNIIEGVTLTNLVKAMKMLGHDAKIVREKRPAKE